MTLQDKMYKYLRQYIGTIANFKVVAKYVAEIAEKEYIPLIHEAIMMNSQKLEKIEQLEAEIAGLKERFKADECDLCNDLQDEVAELKEQLQTAVNWHSGEVDLNDKLLKEVTNLKAQLIESEKSYCDLQKFAVSGEAKLVELQGKLDNMKYLSYGEVEKILKNYISKTYNEQAQDKNGLDLEEWINKTTMKYVTAICNLALPVIIRIGL